MDSLFTHFQGLLIIVFMCSLSLASSNSAFINEVYAESDREIMELLPKVELHAHLHGSIRINTLQELAADKGIVFDFENNYDLNHCFALFALVHQCIGSLSAVTRVFHEVIEDYMKENTIYLELRSTPRALHEDGSSKEIYAKHLSRLVQQHNKDHGEKMLVKLILSVDRAKGYNESKEILSMATDPEFISDGVRTIVGIDFSGNPYGGRFDDFLSIFEEARIVHGLAVTVHTAELKELSESTGEEDESNDETAAILRFNPERLGHALFLQQQHLAMMEERNTIESVAAGIVPPAIEICPTSNLLTMGLKSHAERPFIDYLREIDYPISINTDDRGIFNTSLTEELLHVMYAIKLDLSDLVEIEAESIEQSFASKHEKQLLHDKFWKDISSILNNHAEAELIKKTRPVNKEKLMMDMTYLLTGV